jgi:tetratricopeptide (TPR) repeat protein
MKAIRLFLVVCILMDIFPQNCGAKTLPGKIKIPFQAAQQDTAKINSLTRDGFKYLKSKKKLAEAKVCIDSALLLCERKKIGVPPLLYLLFAEYNIIMSDFTNALIDAMKAFDKAKESGDNKVLAQTMLFLGSYYHRTGFFNESINYYDNCIDLSQKKDLKGLRPAAYYGRSEVYRTVKDIGGLQNSLEQVIITAGSENDSSMLERGYLRLGTFWEEFNKDFRKADSLLKKCLRIALIKKDTFYISNSMANIGWRFYCEKNYDSSLYYYQKSLKYSLFGKQYGVSANSLGNIGTIYRDLKKPERAISYYKKAITYASDINEWYTISWVYDDMHKMYLSMKDTANAYKSFTLFKQYSDSDFVSKTNLGLSSAKLRYDVDSHNKQVQLLSLRLKNQRLLIYGFSILMFLILTIGLLLFRASKLKEKRRLSELNRKMSEIRQANLRQQMNPHFIFNTLNSIQYYMYQHDKLATNNYLTKFSNLMRKVLDNSQHTSISLADELNALSLYLELETIRFKEKFTYVIKVDDEIDPMLYKVPTMLIQPYVENSICHGLMPMEGKGSVQIDIKMEKDYLLCRIEDNGIGREAAQERKASRGVNHNSLGTQIAASRLNLVNELYGTSLKTKYTDLKDMNGEPAGTLVEIHIPIMT